MSQFNFFEEVHRKYDYDFVWFIDEYLTIYGDEEIQTDNVNKVDVDKFIIDLYDIAKTHREEEINNDTKTGDDFIDNISQNYSAKDFLQYLAPVAVNEGDPIITTEFLKDLKRYWS